MSHRYSHGEFEHDVRSRSERRADPVRRYACACWREDQWRCGSERKRGKSSPGLRGYDTSRWPLVVRNVRALRRMEYVKSKGLVNPRPGRKTSGVAGEAQLRKTGWLC